MSMSERDRLLYGMGARDERAVIVAEMNKARKAYTAKADDKTAEPATRAMNGYAGQAIALLIEAVERGDK